LNKFKGEFVVIGVKLIKESHKKLRLGCVRRFW